MNVSMELYYNSATAYNMTGYSGRTDSYTDSTVQLLHWRQQPPLSEAVHLAFAALGIILLFLSVAGNISVMFLFQRFQSLRTFSNALVLNLTVSDFLLAIGNIPMFITASIHKRWVFGDLGCELYAFVGSIASFASVNTLAAISLDRCVVIVNTLPVANRMSWRRALLTVASIWVYSFIWACIPFFGLGGFVLEGTDTSCTFDFLSRTSRTRLHVVLIFSTHFAIPLIVIMCSYLLIYRAISRHSVEFRKAGQIYGEHEIPPVLRKRNQGVTYEAKTARVSLIVIAVFCLSWTPYAIVALIGQFGDASQLTRLNAGIPCLLAKFSTVINPTVYALLHPRYRKKLLYLGACADVDEGRRTSTRRSTVILRSRAPPEFSAL